MKYVKQLLITLLFLVSATTYTYAQLVGSDGFMQGSYVEVGINGCGAFASSTTPPTVM